LLNRPWADAPGLFLCRLLSVTTAIPTHGFQPWGVQAKLARDASSFYAALVAVLNARLRCTVHSVSVKPSRQKTRPRIGGTSFGIGLGTLLPSSCIYV